jgi:hypothetical protein
MTPALALTQRRPVWMALSEFYLDTELEDENFKAIAAVILKSPYSLEEVKAINRYEVFPILQSNMLVPAGTWAGFEEEPLVEKILEHLEKRSALKSFGGKISFLMFKWMHKGSWQKLEKAYNELSNIT